MARFDPIMVREATAARMLEVDLLTFRELVNRGFLPKGRSIAVGVIRWDVEALRNVARGDIQGLLDDGLIIRIVRG